MVASERRSSARSTALWERLQPVVENVTTVLDIGGGTGGLAVPIAERGATVRVIDPSPDALAALARRAQEAAVSDRVVGQQGDVFALDSLVEAGTVDVVLCHGVLDVVGEPARGLQQIATALKPGGVISLVLAQRHAAVIARAMAGHFAQAAGLLDGLGEATTGRGVRHRYTAEQAGELLAAAGFEVTGIQGLRVFADLVPGSLIDLEPGSASALQELERAVADRPEYLPLASQVHLLAQKR
ncbi:class I SAM-dependent methyltransferase [Nocardioides sp. Bht2]|uniref:class I SAM-dependent methyltransferase n=1 Tax=Nocardioides sp. Bht2 TaxID=3392297 RepID=UPI0039B6AA1B